MSNAGGYIKSGMSLFNSLNEGKPHTSITDWIEVLSSDRYDELSLDGIPELVESINILGFGGTQEAARAVRKKLKYGNVHRQIRALVILRALTENAGKGFKLNWADAQIVGRLKEMAQDSLLDPKVKKRLFMVFHAWSIQYADEPRMQSIAALYRQYGGAGPGVRKPSAMPSAPDTFSRTTPTSPTSPARASAPRGGFGDDDLYNHSWAPAPGQRGKDTYADLAAAKSDAEQRRAEREAQLLFEQREAEFERKEREAKRRQDMAALEAKRQREAAEEAERRRKAKEDRNRPAAVSEVPQGKRPKFDLQKEKPQILVAVANAIQAASSLINACRHINREYENVTESPKVQEALDRAKAARRVVIRYLQLVIDETIVGTLLEANEKVVEAIQLYDKLSKPAVLDSDDEAEQQAPKEPAGPKEMELLTKRMEAQKLEADRRSELQLMQERQKRESAKQQARRAQAPPRPSRNSGHPDLQDLDFGPISSAKSSSRLPPPLSPDSERGSFRAGSLSDFSDYDDYDYDSSDDEYRRQHSRSQSRRQSAHYPAQGNSSRRQSMHQQAAPQGRKVRGDSFDPFGDPEDTPVQEKPRMQWTEI